MPKKQQLHDSTEQINFAIQRIDIKRFSLIEPDMDKFLSNEEFDIDGEIGIDFGISVNKNIVVTIKTSIKHPDNEINYLDFILNTEFSISDSKFSFKSNEDIKSLPSSFLTQIASIAYSTARGIIFAKTLGSYLNQYILPLADMNQIVEHYLMKKD